MNERINELRSLATVEKHWDADNGLWVQRHVNINLFAELIAKECAKICLIKAYDQADIDNITSGHKESAYMDAYNTINKTFGVE